MRSTRTVLLVLTVVLLLVPATVLAQGYYFNLAEQIVDLYIQEDGSADLRYVFTFNNDPSAGPIEYVDVGLPPYTFWSEGNISAAVDGQPVSDISASGYQGSGEGVAVGLGPYSIPPGQSGQVEVLVENVQGMLFTAQEPENYASFEFSPVWFGSEYVFGTTEMTVTFHLPPGVQPEEPRFFEAPGGWPEAPEAYLDEEGRVTYTWYNPSAEADEDYQFGAAFPINYVPAGVVQTPSFSQELGVDVGTIITVVLCGIFALVFGLIIVASFASTEKRKLQYLPPKVAIEGHGIKRGLTAVEAAILLEQPLDKVMTMILFSLIKKEAAQVVTRDPLELEIASPLPDNLRPYEEKFLEAFRESDKARRRLLQDMTVDLIESVSNKMKGFSREETVAYYRDIMNRAWAQVEAAETPEVKSEKFSENIEWTMLDREYDDRTRRTFGGGPVFVPVWWPRYDPVYRSPGGPATRPAGQPSTPGNGGVNLPHLPGSDFAASVVNGVQTFAGSVIGNVAEFTGNVTQRTNPVPVATSTRSGGGGGRSGGGCACACACACAGCACACAGGGR